MTLCPVRKGRATNYNGFMRAITTSILASALAMVLTAAHAQAPQANTQIQPKEGVSDRANAEGEKNAPEPTDKYNQKAEYIRVEDAGSRIDEVRIGGQTQSIHVQPKVGNMPGYEVKSTDGARSRPDGFGDTQSKKRVWNIGNF